MIVNKSVFNKVHVKEFLCKSKVVYKWDYDMCETKHEFSSWRASHSLLQASHTHACAHTYAHIHTCTSTKTEELTGELYSKTWWLAVIRK